MRSLSSEWIAAVTLFSAGQRSQGIARTSITARRQHLEHLARRIDRQPTEVDADTLTLYIADQQWAQETLRGRVTTFRTFFAWLHARGEIVADPAATLGKVKPSPPAPRPVPDDVYITALARADETERLWVDLAAEHGLRRAEIAVVAGRDIVQTLLGHDLIVHGKGGKIRTVPLTNAMARMLRERAEALGGGYLFPGDDDGHISPRWLGNRVTRLMDGDWTTHKLRHRAATRFWVAGGGDPYAVADLMGWSSLEMVRRYVALPEDRKRRIVEAASRVPSLTPA